MQCACACATWALIVVDEEEKTENSRGTRRESRPKSTNTKPPKGADERPSSSEELDLASAQAGGGNCIPPSVDMKPVSSGPWNTMDRRGAPARSGEMRYHTCRFESHCSSVPQFARMRALHVDGGLRLRPVHHLSEQQAQTASQVHGSEARERALLT